MAKLVLTDATILLGNTNISGETNQVRLDATRDEHDTTNFGSNGDREFVVGHRSATASVEGMFELGEADRVLFNRTAGVPLTLTVTNPDADGDLAYGFQSATTSFNRRHPVADLLTYTATLRAEHTMVRGNILHTGSETVTGDGAGLEAGAVTAAQFVYAWLQIDTAASTLAGGNTLDVTVESDVNNTWAGPTTRFTFSQETNASSHYQWATRVAGAITDTWWRASFTISGGTWVFRVGLAIQ